jgi:hypothetical protein
MDEKPGLHPSWSRWSYPVRFLYVVIMVAMVAGIRWVVEQFVH